MRVGDRVKFRMGSRAWIALGLPPDMRGEVVDTFRDPADRGVQTADVRFPDSDTPRRGIDSDELEVISWGSSAVPLPANF
jgi:hypothetical protein